MLREMYVFYLKEVISRIKNTSYFTNSRSKTHFSFSRFFFTQILTTPAHCLLTTAFMLNIDEARWCADQEGAISNQISRFIGFNKFTEGRPYVRQFTSINSLVSFTTLEFQINGERKL